VARLMAPLAPFYADSLYTDLMKAGNKTGAAKSVHLADFPKFEVSFVDEELEHRMEMAQKITSMVLSLRKKHAIIVRQPLQCIMIPVSDAKEKERIEEMQNLIKSEVNVKEIRFVNAIKLQKTIKCNFRVMGKKYGKQMSAVSKAVAAMGQEQISLLEQQGSLKLTLDASQEITLLREEVEIFNEDIPGWSVANEGTFTVALDLEITEDLRREGIAREIVKRIQTYRKESGFEITDHIHVILEDRAEIKDAVEQFKDYICGQVLCDKFEWGSGKLADKFDFEEFSLNVQIEKQS
jgi:isoleucyl-tRNA synthetase